MATTVIPEVTFQKIGAALQPVQDPEIHMSIVDLGLVYGAEIGQTEKGLSVVPLRLYFKGGRVKAELGVVRGKKLYDKRADEKKRDDERDMQRAVRTR